MLLPRQCKQWKYSFLGRLCSYLIQVKAILFTIIFSYFLLSVNGLHHFWIHTWQLHVTHYQLHFILHCTEEQHKACGVSLLWVHCSYSNVFGLSYASSTRLYSASFSQVCRQVCGAGEYLRRWGNAICGSQVYQCKPVSVSLLFCVQTFYQESEVKLTLERSIVQLQYGFHLGSMTWAISSEYV